MIKYTVLNRNTITISAGEGFPMVVFCVLKSIIVDWCVVTSLLLGGVRWWPHGEVSLDYKDYCIFISVK